MTPKFAENSAITPQSHQTTTSQQDTTLQQWPPPLIGTQQTNTTNNGHLFQNLFENQIPRAKHRATHAVQWSITSPISQHDRGIHTDPSTSHRQQKTE